MSGGIIALNRIYRKIITFIFIIGLFFTNFTYVYAANSIDYVEFTSKNIKQTTNGANVKLSPSGTDGLDINISTKGLNNGYYTTYLYENKNRDWSNYSAIGVNIDNESDEPLRLNLNIKGSDGKVLSVADEDVVFLKGENDDLVYNMKPSYGTIELPKKFNGTIYLPFNSFKQTENINPGKENGISKITSWGIFVVLKENQESNFRISNCDLIPRNSELNKYFSYNFSVDGDDTVEIPVAGEGISYYKIKANNDENISKEKVSFKLIEPVNGVTMDDGGKLTLTSEVESQKIKIAAIMDGTAVSVKEVQLLKSWTVDAKEADGTSKSIPKANEVSKIIDSNNILMNNNMLIVVRVIIILITLGFGVLYWYWKGKYR